MTKGLKLAILAKTPIERDCYCSISTNQAAFAVRRMAGYCCDCAKVLSELLSDVMRTIVASGVEL